MNFKELATARFSVRKFTDEAVSQADLDAIMTCVQLAPSACNRQPWKQVAWRHRPRNSRGASSLGCRRPWTGHLLGVQLRCGGREAPVSRRGIRGRGDHSAGTHRRGLSEPGKEKEGSRRNLAKTVNIEALWSIRNDSQDRRPTNGWRASVAV